ncbi:MAG TPA: hypothetical protein VF631_05225 [Allosphingosinicella sp.]|jgi:hypothetical protein|uniref:hypothetical protein n=1 Tax=Allosphingosinicella sp. TaxID=2823234 RepID=UPI002F295B2E
MQLRLDITGLRSRAFHSATFSFARIDLDLSGDVPVNLDAMDFPARGAIVADIAATGPRSLSILAVEGC